MPRTYFHDCTKDDGRPVMVEYSFAGGSPTTYSPRFGADGGDGCEVQIVSVMPNTPEYEALCQSHWTPGPNATTKETLAAACAAVALTDAENERISNWIAEHHVEDDDDDYF